MSNLENIQQTILEDAKREAEEIVRKETERWEILKDEKLKELEYEAEKERAKAKQEEPQMEDTLRSGAQREARDLVLSAKQGVIDRVFQLAKEKLSAISDDKYQEIVERMMAKREWDSEAVIEIPENRNYVSKTHQVKKSPDVRSGFSIQDKEIRYNFEFDQLIDFIREDLEVEIADMIEEG